MVVATTRLLASSPRAWRSRAQASMTASPLTTLPFSSAKRARSASPSKVMPMEAPETLTWAATISGWRAPQCSLMLRPSGEAWVTSTVPWRDSNSCGATELAAPLAQSRTMWRLSSEMPGTASRRKRM